MNIGDKYKEKFSFSQKDVDLFSILTGDKNPIHLDENYAKKTRFKKRIIHGFLSSSIFSKIFAMNFPGPGCIYLGQNIKFLKPMYVNEKYEAHLSVLKVKEEKNIATIETIIVDENGCKVITGDATIKF